MPGAGEIVYSPQVEKWIDSLTPYDRSSMLPVVIALARFGDDLQSMASKQMKSRRQHDIHELRSLAGNLRVLYTYDRDRGNKPVLLVGGDKTGEWNRWYDRHLDRAVATRNDYLRSQGRRPGWITRRIGERGLGR